MVLRLTLFIHLFLRFSPEYAIIYENITKYNNVLQRGDACESYYWYRN